MTPSDGCDLCGNPIQPGEAWMEANDDGGRRVAHAGCVYRDEPDGELHARWQPGEGPVRQWQ